jgi:predicted nucleotidyltransferase
VTSVEFPTPLHKSVLGEVLPELRADPGVRGVMLAGSLARGTARADSDLDVVVVAAGDTRAALWRSHKHPLPIDFLVHTPTEWRNEFAPTRIGDESWGYAFLDGVVLYDPEGIVGRLTADAAEIHARYRVPASIKAHYAWLWNHVCPKMQAVLRRDDPTEIGWAAAAMTNDLVRTVWAVNDLPNPSLDLGTFQRHLDSLTIPPDAADRLAAILRASPRETLQLQIELIAFLEPYLAISGSADEGPPPWIR